MIERAEPSITELIGRIDSALSADNDELSSLRQELAALRAVDAERDEALREAELTLSQLHQSQQVLQRYYRLCQKQSEMLEASESLHTKSFVLLAKAYD